MKEITEFAKNNNIPYSTDEPMSKHTTFKIGGKAKLMLFVESEEQVASAVKECKKYNQRYIAVGNGSNLLVSDDGIDAVVIEMGKGFSDVRLIEDETVYAESGAQLMKVCRFALEHGLSGLEFAYGIPGSCGGAAFMNAGAYGGEMKDVLVSVTYLTREGEIVTEDAANLDLSYRHSIFEENGGCILSAKFHLKRGDSAAIKARMDELMQKRVDKQPLDKPSAGSTFKRPAGAFAAALIDQCGLRGYRHGGAAVSDKHCGFVVNLGGATCADVLALCDEVRAIVKEKTGYDLEKEIRVVR